MCPLPSRSPAPAVTSQESGWGNGNDIFLVTGVVAVKLPLDPATEKLFEHPLRHHVCVGQLDLFRFSAAITAENQDISLGPAARFGSGSRRPAAQVVAATRHHGTVMTLTDLLPPRGAAPDPDAVFGAFADWAK